MFYRDYKPYTPRSLKVKLLLDYRGVRIFQHARRKYGYGRQNTTYLYITGVHGPNAYTLANQFDPIQYNGRFNPVYLESVKRDIDHILDNGLLKYVPSEKTQELAREMAETMNEVRNEEEVA